MYTIWAEDSIPQLNSVAYINDEVQELFAEGGKTYDAEVRKEKYGEAQRLIAEDAPYVFLYLLQGVERSERTHPGHRTHRAGHRLEQRRLVHRRIDVRVASRRRWLDVTQSARRRLDAQKAWILSPQVAPGGAVTSAERHPFREAAVASRKITRQMRKPDTRLRQEPVEVRSQE